MNYAHLIKAINSATTQLQHRAAAAVNQALVLRNWLVGAYLVEFEQNGKDRAKYGERLLERVAEDMAARDVAGLEVRNLRNCRLLFLVYPQIRQTLSAEFASRAKLLPIRQTVSAESMEPTQLVIRGTVSPELPTPLSPPVLLQLSWSNLQELVRLEDPWQRAFYENECLKGHWSVRQLRRQIGSLLFERTGLSQNKAAIIRRARRQEPEETLADLIRDPYVLEFTGLAQRPEYRESDLERALLDHLQSFLLELGEGFCFEARQRRISVGGKNDYIDLVFYHRRLRCHVLLDLKLRAFQHGDAGQIHPVRYAHKHEPVLLRLRSPKPQRSPVLHRLQCRLENPNPRTRRRACYFHKGTAPVGIGLLRGLPVPARCDKTGEVSEDSLGKEIPQVAAGRLSNGVNFYLNWWKAHAVEPGDQPPVGIILCSGRDHVEVEFATAGLSNKLFVSRYLVALPSAESLRAFLEKDRERIEGLMPPKTQKRKPAKRQRRSNPRRRTIP